MASDREGLVKLKTSIKEVHKAGVSYSTRNEEFSKALNLVSESNVGSEEEVQLGMAFQKFAIITRYLADQLKDSVIRLFRMQDVYLYTCSNLNLMID